MRGRRYNRFHFTCVKLTRSRTHSWGHSWVWFRVALQKRQTRRKGLRPKEKCSDCAKSLLGEAPCGSAVHGKVDEMSPAPYPLNPPPPSPNPPPTCPDPLPLDPSCPWTTPHRRQGGQGRIVDITSKGLRTAVALSTASCSDVDQWAQTLGPRTMQHGGERKKFNGENAMKW